MVTNSVPSNLLSNDLQYQLILGNPGADSGAEDENQTGGKKFDEQKYERKIRAPGDKLFTHQFQTAERILAPDWAERFSAQSGGPTICPWVSEDDTNCTIVNILLVRFYTMFSFVIPFYG